MELEEQSHLPVSATPKFINLVGVWPGVESPYLKIIPAPIKLSTGPEAPPGVEAIRHATSLFISKTDKDNGLRERKEVADAKSKLVKEEEENRTKHRIEESEKFAKL